MATTRSTPTIQRFVDRIQVSLTQSYNGTACWNITKSLNWYGTIQDNQHRTMAHRFSYEYFKGEIPDGLEIDHLCRNIRCANPDHLEPVTGSENTIRGASPALTILRKLQRTHCPHGHPYDAENTRIGSDGERLCRRCARLANAEWWRKNRTRSRPYSPYTPEQRQRQQEHLRETMVSKVVIQEVQK